MKKATKAKETLHEYKCSACGGVFLSPSDRKWFKSYCNNSGLPARMLRQDGAK